MEIPSLTSLPPKHRSNHLREIAIAPSLYPQSLGIQFRPLLLRAHRVSIHVQVGAYQGAPLGKRVLAVVVCQRVRLYKFFIEPRQPLSTFDSCTCTAMNSTAS